MNKYLFLLFFSLQLYALEIPMSTQQLLVVTTQGFNTSNAIMQAYERNQSTWQKVFKPIQVNLGRNGLAWGEGLHIFSHLDTDPYKREGDGKSPAGMFELGMFFGYEAHRFDYPYLQVNEQTLCIDQSDSTSYNQIITTDNKSQFSTYEDMKRIDNLYALGITVKHNTRQLEGYGSCIFIHIEKAEGSATAGCTSMQREALFQLMKWLKAKQNPLLLQLPAMYMPKEFR